RFDVDELPQLQDSTSSCLSLVFFPVVLALSLSVHAAYLFALFWHFGAAAIADWPATADTKTATASAPEAVTKTPFSMEISLSSSVPFVAAQSGRTPPSRARACRTAWGWRVDPEPDRAAGNDRGRPCRLISVLDFAILKIDTFALRLGPELVGARDVLVRLVQTLWLSSRRLRACRGGRECNNGKRAGGGDKGTFQHRNLLGCPVVAPRRFSQRRYRWRH